MIAQFKKNSYKWSPLAFILIIVLGCVSLPDAEHEETAVTSGAKPSASAKAGPTYRLVLNDTIAGMRVLGRRFSPGGDRIVFASEGKLYVANQTVTTIRPLIDDPGPWETTGGKWSPDGRLFAYIGRREVVSNSGAEGVQAIFIISPDGGWPRQIGPEAAGYVLRVRWLPDGRHLSYHTHGVSGGLHTLTLDGEEVRFIPNKDMAGEGRRLVQIGFYSPDGRWLTYTRTKEDATHGLDMDLCIIPAAGGTPRRLTHLPGFNSAGTWAPDNRSLYFVSGPAEPGRGTRNIWKLTVDPETGLAKGEPQQVTFFQDVYIAKVQVLGDGDRIAFDTWRSTNSIRIAGAFSPYESHRLVSGRYPQVSPDGRTVYYVNKVPGEEGIYAVPRHGGTPRRLAESLPTGASHLSPDGQTLTYCVKIDNEHHIFALSTTGGKPRRVVDIKNVGHAVAPRWSPDGSLLAYADSNDLYVIPAAGGQPRELAHMKRGWEESSVRWSPDGKFIAAFGMTKPERNAVFVVPASGGELRQLTPDADYKEGLEWHPDGKRLTYHIDTWESGTYQVYLDGRPPSLLFNSPDIWDYVGIWAPGGRRFFFTNVHGIYVYDEASGKTTLVSDPVPNRRVGVPCWSRDGKTMAWWETRTTSVQTWVMENFLPEDVGK